MLRVKKLTKLKIGNFKKSKQTLLTDAEMVVKVFFHVVKRDKMFKIINSNGHTCTRGIMCNHTESGL